MAKYRAREIRAMLDPLTKIVPAITAAADIIEGAEEAERNTEDITRSGLRQKALLEQEIEQLEIKKVRLKAATEDDEKSHTTLVNEQNNKLSLIHNSVSRAQTEHDQLIRRQQDELAEATRGAHEVLRRVNEEVKLKDGELRKKTQELARAEGALHAKREEKRKIEQDIVTEQQRLVHVKADLEEQARALEQELVAMRRTKAGIEDDIRQAQNTLVKAADDAEGKVKALRNRDNLRTTAADEEL